MAIMTQPCFAYKEGRKCRVLVVPRCTYPKCSFYKTQEQYDADCEESDRINREKGGIKPRMTKGGSARW